MTYINPLVHENDGKISRRIAALKNLVPEELLSLVLAIEAKFNAEQQRGGLFACGSSARDSLAAFYKDPGFRDYLRALMEKPLFWSVRYQDPKPNEKKGDVLPLFDPADKT